MSIEDGEEFGDEDDQNNSDAFLDKIRQRHRDTIFELDPNYASSSTPKCTYQATIFIPAIQNQLRKQGLRDKPAKTKKVQADPQPRDLPDTNSQLDVREVEKLFSKFVKTSKHGDNA